MCALCLDACDSVMEKVGRPLGLIRYESLDGLEGKERPPLYKQPRVLVTNMILLAALSGIIYGLSTIDGIELKVLHARQPLYVLQSDGSIQNRYTLKILNKLTEDVEVQISATGPDGLIIASETTLSARHGTVTPATVFVRVPKQNLLAETQPISFQIETLGREQLLSSNRESIFIGPKL